MQPWKHTGTPSIEIRPSSIHGEGLFAKRTFKPSDIICRAKGDIANSRSQISYQIGTNKHFEPIGILEGEINALAKVNHACDPNSRVRFDPQSRFLVLEALRNIAKDEEITTDYCDTENELAYPFYCRCKPKCHGFIDCKRDSKGSGD